MTCSRYNDTIHYFENPFCCFEQQKSVSSNKIWKDQYCASFKSKLDIRYFWSQKLVSCTPLHSSSRAAVFVSPGSPQRQLVPQSCNWIIRYAIPRGAGGLSRSSCLNANSHAICNVITLLQKYCNSFKNFKHICINMQLFQYFFCKFDILLQTAFNYANEL